MKEGLTKEMREKLEEVGNADRRYAVPSIPSRPALDLLDRLASEGLLAKSADGADGTFACYQLTPEGLAALEGHLATDRCPACGKEFEGCACRSDDLECALRTYVARRIRAKLKPEAKAKLEARFLAFREELGRACRKHGFVLYAQGDEYGRDGDLMAMFTGRPASEDPEDYFDIHLGIDERDLVDEEAKAFAAACAAWEERLMSRHRRGMPTVLGEPPEGMR